MGWDEIVGQEEIRVDDATSRAILERSLDEQSFWLRKTLEVLIDLVCFSQTNEDSYYRHLLLPRLRELARQHPIRLFDAHDLFQTTAQI